jgi:D-arginine dehydrogenase
MPMRRSDVAVIGAGMAGASIAAELAGSASVVVLEAEDQPGRHATGRSAAFWSETYGGPLIQPLTSASGGFLADPPSDFHERPLLHRRGAVSIAREGDEALLAAMRELYAAGDVRFEWLERAELEARIPGLRSEWVRGLLEESCSDIDVAALHAAYLRRARRRGAELAVGAPVTAITRSGRNWLLDTNRGSFAADVIVNAAGAWADAVAAMAGIAPIGIQPYRRTMVQLRVAPPAPADLPLVLDARGAFYFKPEAGGRVWMSPHDETPCPPSDCAAEEIDVAIAVDRLQQTVDWAIDRVEHSWAGLRSFAPDRLPVYGFASRSAGFFWFAGQGGFGIQTAPAAARIGAMLLLGGAPDPMIAAIDAAPYSAARFAN